MAKYPNFHHRGMPDLGCFSTLVIILLTAICPPLIIVYLIIYSIFENCQDTPYFLAKVFFVICIVFVLIDYPILAVASFFSDNKELKDASWLFIFITIGEIIASICIGVNKYKIVHETPLERRIRLEQKKKQEIEELYKIAPSNPEIRRLKETWEDIENNECAPYLEAYDLLKEDQQQEIKDAIQLRISKGISLTPNQTDIYLKYMSS